MASSKGRNGPRWDRCKSIVYSRPSSTCGLCGQWVNKKLPYRGSDGRVDPRSKSLNHIIPLEYGGSLYDPANLEIVHLGCNARQGAEIVNVKTRGPRRTNRRPIKRRLNQTRDW